MIQPHGGKLVDRALEGKKKDAALASAGRLARLTVDAEIVSDLENIATGVYSPLEGFLGEADFRSVLAGSRLRSDVAWTVPIVLDTDEATADRLKIGDDVLLATEDGRPVAILHLEEKYGFDKGETAEKVFGTRDPAHPGVAKVLGMKDVLLAGPIDLIEITPTPVRPLEARAQGDPGPVRGQGLEDGRRLPDPQHPPPRPRIRPEVRPDLHRRPVHQPRHRPEEKGRLQGRGHPRVLRGGHPALLRQGPDGHGHPADGDALRRAAGAIHHAILRKNFGCTHIIIGRDHAGVGSYYAPFAAQEIFDDFPDLGITPMFFRSFSYCRTCGAVVNEKICPHPPAEHIQFRGTKIRDLLVDGECPPAELMRPEVAEVIMHFKDPFNE